MEKSEFNRAFGRYLKEKRIKKGWSQTDLASALGNNPQNVSRIERGELTPTIYWMEKLAMAFDCKSSEIMAEFEKNIKM
ncbi:helix-turn-helix transcriptional regulator [Crocinitomicaceae bacterium CZZ-1]|uniref:Helix-turn-helix transcriptional regulator n=1 Tax=Taishania pollutisoli TaxID=2766479 RepID=A0A8J6PF28_9FLAO|nr:helix-turn-helix transcriptional regulator [Taishania pollutisoli]MBC9813100.1 helix-turn-helix transcriptional regulator [Taishania pollutisoli]